MYKLSRIRKFMAQQYDEHKAIRSVEVEGETLEEALSHGSIELNIPVKNLEYEVLEQGEKGSFGAGKKNWKIKVYKALAESIFPQFEEFTGGLDINDISFEEKQKDLDGEAFVVLTADGVFLKVTAPLGKGKRATEKQALDVLKMRKVKDFNPSVVAKVVKNSDGEYIKVGSFDYNPANDALMSVDITDMEMKAFMEVRHPGENGADLTADNIRAILKNNGVISGLKDDAIQDFEDKPQYGTAILIAEGEKAANGNDAKVIYNFKTDKSNVILKEKNGKVDFKELNIVENVVAGQFLAKKVPAQEGASGRTVTGKILPSKSGKDVEIGVGKNVRLSEDGLTAISEINGQVLLINKKINVEPVYTVTGDVNLHTGNILFLGTVIVKGNVDDGFSVKASGNIEVMGTVGKSELDAEGNIIVHQGILGKDGGKIRSGGSVFAKFIQNTNIEAESNVGASEGIIHSYVDSNTKIICQGRRASIVGGRLRAAEDINAKNLGSVAGTETILEVGYDPKSKERLVEVEENINSLMKELEEIELNIKTLNNLKKVQRKFPPEKEEYLQELNEKRSELVSKVEEFNKEAEEIKFRLASIKKQGKISASDKVFPGVKIFIRDANLEVRNEFKNVTFVLEHNNITTTKYEAVEEDLKRRM